MLLEPFVEKIDDRPEGRPPHSPKPRPRRASASFTADLDLSTRDGRDTLDRRLAIAASEACGAAADVDLAGRNVVRQCRKDVLAQARARTDAIVAGLTAERTIVVAAR